MKKNILIIILVLANISFFVYSFIKADEAEKATMEAEEQNQALKILQEQVVEMQQLAIDNAAEAARQRAMVEEALADCRNSK